MNSHPRKSAFVFVLGLAIGAIVCLASRPLAADDPAKLTADELAFLDELVEELLVDPKGAERVTVPIVVRSVWAHAGTTEIAGWLRRDAAGKPHEVFLIDRRAVAPPEEKSIRNVDFVAGCKARYVNTPPVGKDNERREVFDAMHRGAVGVIDSDTVNAAWLHRLGHDDLAALALAAARKDTENLETKLRAQLAWSAFAGLVHAYMVRADDEALAYGKHLLKTYPEEAKEYEQADAIVADLERRRAKGTFGQEPAAEWPKEFSTWDAATKTKFLIEALDEVDARQWGQPGGVALGMDRRVEALIEVGEPAIPALLDALEHDERLTRSVHFWRDFSQDRTVLGVREAVLTAVMSILRVQVFEAGSTGDNFTSRGEEGTAKVVERLRSYWEKYGGMPFDERMMKVLTDPNSTADAKHEAAANLATPDARARLGTTVWSGGNLRDDGPPKPKPTLAKFSDPTVAEAILAAFDAELAEISARPLDTTQRSYDSRDYDRRNAERIYFAVLSELADKRIVGDCARRSIGAASLRMRRGWATLAQQLGDPRPLDRLAEEFRQGTLPLPPPAIEGESSDDPRMEELTAFVKAFVDAKTSATELAVLSLAELKHPYRPDAERIVLGGSHGFGDDLDVWFRHPVCLTLLRQSLDDLTPTGAVYEIKDGGLSIVQKSSTSQSSIPEPLADPNVRRKKAEGRVCDLAADRLGEMVVGVPWYSPLFIDADERLARLRSQFDRLSKRLRLATPIEQELAAGPHTFFDVHYLPDFRPLGRGATEAEVRAGAAIFHLEPRGKPADVKLPAVVELKETYEDGRPRRGLVLQAEIDAEGRAVYGIVENDGFSTLRDDAVKNVKTLAQYEADRRAEYEKARKEMQKHH